MSFIEAFFTNFKIAGGINRRKPILFKKLLKRYIKSFINGKKYLRFMDIAIDYSCNFQCQHCSAVALENKEQIPLSHEEYAKFAVEAMELGVLSFHFTGGEPLLMTKNLFKIIKLFKPNENLISVQTNGWYVNELFLQEYKKLGGDILCVSVDSADPAIHDDFRCKEGSWDRAIEALKSARRLGLRTLMSATLTHFNINNGDFEAMISLSKNIGANLSINLAVAAGRWKDNRDHLLNKDDRIKLNKFIKLYPHVRTDFESNWRIKGCSAFKEKCYLTPYGEVLPCPFIHISFGNIRVISLSKIREIALQNAYLRQYHTICIAAEDRNFIDVAGCYNIDYSRLPIKYSDSPLFNSISDGY